MEYFPWMETKFDHFRLNIFKYFLHFRPPYAIFSLWPPVIGPSLLSMIAMRRGLLDQLGEEPRKHVVDQHKLLFFSLTPSQYL